MTSKKAKAGLFIALCLPLCALGFNAKSAPLTEEVKVEKENGLQWERDYALWMQVQKDDKIEEYSAYLSMFPDGEFADLAKQRITKLAGQQNAQRSAAKGRINRASEADEHFFMTPSEAIEVQAHLSVIGFDTGGIDGRFGMLTRKAILVWQQNRGLPVSGYLNWEQFEMLRADSESVAKSRNADGRGKVYLEADNSLKPSR